MSRIVDRDAHPLRRLPAGRRLMRNIGKLSGRHQMGNSIEAGDDDVVGAQFPFLDLEYGSEPM